MMLPMFTLFILLFTNVLVFALNPCQLGHPLDHAFQR